MEFRTMTQEELTRCADLAARAFFDYPYFTNYFPDEKQRDRFLHRLLEVELKIHRSLAEILVAVEDGEIAAVAILCDPDYHQPTDPQYIRAGFLKVFLAGGFVDVNRWLGVERKAGIPCHSQENAWYLSMLTVDPRYQGRGVGTAMLQECMLPKIRERRGTDFNLFTNSEENCRFYEKNGFSQFDRMFFDYQGKRLGSWSYQMRLAGSHAAEPLKDE